MTKLSDLAGVFRSKNAEPFRTTIDVFFPNGDDYMRVKRSGAVTIDSVSRLYKIPVEAVYGIFFVDNVRALKVTLVKYGNGGYRGQGDPELTDMFGSQMHVPLLGLEIS